MQNLIGFFTGRRAIPAIVGPMEYVPSGNKAQKIASYMGYNWFLCSKHMEAIKKIDQVADNILRDQQIWSKLYHVMMIAFEAIPIIGHLVSAIEAINQSVELLRSYSNLISKKYSIDVDESCYRYTSYHDRQAVESWIEKVKEDPAMLGSVRLEIRKDKYFAKQVLYTNGLLFKHFPQEIREDKILALTAVSQNNQVFECLNETLKKDESLLLACIENSDGEFFKKYVPDNLKTNYAFCLHAVTRNGLIYPYIPEEFHNVEQIVLKAFDLDASQDSTSYEKNCVIFKSVPENLQKNPSFVREILSRNGLVLQFLDETERNNKENVRCALKGNYRAYEFMGESLKNDKEFFLEMMLKVNHKLFIYASDEQKKNKNIVSKVVEGVYDLFFIADPSIREDEATAFKAMRWVKYAYDAHRFLYGKLKDNKKVALAVEKIMGNHGEVLNFVGSKLQDDEDFVYRCVKNSAWGYSLEFASDRLRKDEAFLVKCLTLKPKAFEKASRKVKYNQDFVLKLVQGGVLLSDIHQNYLDTFDKQFFMQALKELKPEDLPIQWGKIPFKIREDQELALLALDCGLRLENITKLYLELYDEDFYLEALKKFKGPVLEKQWKCIPELEKTVKLKKTYQQLKQQLV